MKNTIEEIIPVYMCIGFSGSRFAIPKEIMEEAAQLVRPEAHIITGCARGVDSFFRQRFPEAEVFSVKSGKWGHTRGSYAARSAACVKAVRQEEGLWISFPSSHCPQTVSPNKSQKKCFNGSKAGTWASAAYAIGLGTPTLIRLPAGITPPKEWQLKALNPGWYLSEGLKTNSPPLKLTAA